MAFSLDKIGNKSLYDVSAPVDPSPVQKANAPVQEQVSGGKLTMAAAPSPEKYVADLTKILRNCSQETWRTVSTDDIAALKKKIRDLKIDSGKNKETVAAWQGLEQDAVNFGEKLKEIQRYTVEGLAKALYEGKELYMGKAHYDVKVEAEVEMSAAEKLIEGALNDLEELSSKLTTLSEGLQNLPDELRYEIDDMKLLCDSRASELDQLCVDLVELARKTETENKVYFDSISSDPRGEGEGDDSVINLTKGMGGVMHGNLEAVENMGFGVEERIRNNSLGMVKTDGKYEKVGEVVDLKKMADLYGSTIKKKTPEATAELATKHLGQRMSQDLLAPFLEVIKANENELKVSDTIEPILQKGQKIATRNARMQVFKMLPNTFAELVPVEWDHTTKDLTALMWHHANCLSLLKSLVENQESGNKAGPTEADVTAALKDYASFVEELLDVDAGYDIRHDIIEALTSVGYDPSNTSSPVGNFLGNLYNYDCQCKVYRTRLEEKGPYAKDVLEAKKDLDTSYYAYFVESLLGSFCRPGLALSLWKDLVMGVGVSPDDKSSSAGIFLGSDIEELFKGGAKPKLSQIALAGTYGVGTKWVEPAFNDTNALTTKELGSGVSNSVTKITYKDGRVVVFKPDFKASRMLAGSHSHRGGFDTMPHALHLNIASNIIANRLGVGKRLVKTTPMFHNGQFGVGMSMAPGKSIFGLKKHVKTRPGKKSDVDVVCGLLNSKLQNERDSGLRIVNDIVHQTVDLQWLDLLTGQGDRHAENYFVDIDFEHGGKVTVTGIDNDACMAKTRSGLTKILMDATKFDTLREKLRQRIYANPYIYGLAPMENDDDFYVAAMGKVDELIGKCIVNRTPNLNNDDPDRMYELDFSKDLSVEMLCDLKEILGIMSYNVPKVMSRTMCDTLNAIRSNKEEKAAFIQELAALLPKESVDAFKQRLEDMLELVADPDAHGLVIVDDDEDKTAWLNDNVQKAMSLPPPPMDANLEPTEENVKSIDPNGWADFSTNVFMYRDMPRMMSQPAVLEFVNPLV